VLLTLATPPVRLLAPGMVCYSPCQAPDATPPVRLLAPVLPLSGSWLYATPLVRLLAPICYSPCQAPGPMLLPLSGSWPHATAPVGLLAHECSRLGTIEQRILDTNAVKQLS
jgi:hypothetical protein